jgi:hypothetical protein
MLQRSIFTAILSLTLTEAFALRHHLPPRSGGLIGCVPRLRTPDIVKVAASPLPLGRALAQKMNESPDERS